MGNEVKQDEQTKTRGEKPPIGTRLRRRLLRLLGEQPGSNKPRQRDLVLASDADKEIVQSVRGLTMTNPLRIHALLDAVDYVVRRDLPGAFVECGVWRGGSVLAMLRKLQALGVDDRDVYLYDTFEGMTEPTDEDTSAFEAPAMDSWNQAQETGGRGWDEFFSAEMYSIDTVRETLYQSGYPKDRLHFVQGPVEETIPGTLPAEIALLRLDTDWYESTRHELLHMYPLLPSGGVLLIDDYGHWDGCRRAVDEYFATEAHPILLNRIDYTARVAVKA